jgi:cell division transport system permease protein
LQAAATLLMLLAGSFALTVHSASQALDAAVSRRLIVQVVDADPVRRARSTRQVIDRLTSDRAVEKVEHVADAEVARLIDPYIGGVMPPDLPLPALVEARLGADADAAAVTSRIGTLPGVHVTAAGEGMQPLAALLDGLRNAALLAMMVTAAVTGLIATLAARAALAADHASLALLHELGATDRQISMLVLRRIGTDTGIGAGVGLLLGIVVIALLGARLAPLGLAGPGAVAFAGLALLPVALIVIALIAAQASLLLSMGRTR